MLVEMNVIEHVLDDGHAKIVGRRPESGTLLCHCCCCCCCVGVIVMIIIMETIVVITTVVIIMVAVNMIIVIERRMARCCRCCCLVERMCMFMQARGHGATTTNVMMTGMQLWG